MRPCRRRGHSAEEIAHELGKSKGYIYSRLKLCGLAKASRTAFYDGKLTASTALLWRAFLSTREPAARGAQGDHEPAIWRSGHVVPRCGRSYPRALHDEPVRPPAFRPRI